MPSSLRRPPRILILGTGALACAMGARLARFGRAAVTMAGAWPAGIEALTTRGIVVNEPGGAWSAKVRVVPLHGPFGPADVVIVATKSHRTAAIAPTAARALLPEGLVVTLQNGIGNRDALMAVCGAGRVVVGVVSLTATLIGPGEVRISAGRVILGDQAPGVVAFAGVLANSRIEAEVSHEIDRMFWAKLAVTCAIDPLCALTSRRKGALLETPEPCDTLVKAAREVGAVAQARGIDLGGDPATLAVETAEAATESPSAMSLDLARGTPTEVDAQNGAVVLEGRRRGIATPVNEYLWQRIREKEGRPIPPEAAPPV